MAAKSMKLESVPCIRLDHLTDAQKKAYVIADNKLALNAGWNDQMLGLELAALAASSERETVLSCLYVAHPPELYISPPCSVPFP